MPPTLKLKSSSPRQTTLIGRTLAQHLRPGTVVALRGDLGAGKTLISQAIGAGLGVKTSLRSPTFVVEARHKVHHSRIRMLYHLDLYRMRRLGATDTQFIREVMTDQRGVVLIEWADRLARLPAGVIQIRFQITANGRVLRISGLSATAWKSLARLPLANAAGGSPRLTPASSRRRLPSARR